MPSLLSLPKQPLPLALLATLRQPKFPAKKRASHLAPWVLICLGQLLLSPNALADNESPSTNTNASDTSSTTLSAYLEGYYLHDFIGLVSDITPAKIPSKKKCQPPCSMGAFLPRPIAAQLQRAG